MIKLSIKTKFMQAATMLLLMLLTTATAWAGDTKILYDNSTEAKAAAGGLLNFYSNEACNVIISVNTDNNVSSGSMVYIKAWPDGIHKFGATDGNNLVSFIHVEVVTPGNDGEVLPVSKFADGIYTFTMPSDASLHVSVTASFPERSTNADALTYIDEDGVEQTKAAGTVYVLDGSEFTLGMDNQEIWYIAQGTDLAYTHTLSYYGNTHLILEDGAAMSVTTSGYDDGFHATGNSSLTICGQGGETEGSLTVRGYDGIDAQGNVIICSGIIDIASNSEGDGIGARNITICGGQVTATGGSSGSSYGLNAGDNITLGWHKNTDRIMATGRDYAGYSTVVNIATDQRFVAFNAPTGTAASAIVSGTVSDQSTIAGKTLKPLDGNYIEATSGLQIGSLNGKDFTVRDADFSIDYAHYYLFSAAAEDVVVYYSNEYLPTDYHSIVWNVTGTSLKAYNYFGSGPRNMDNRYATFDMPGNADVTIDYESGGDGRMYQMPGGPLGSDSYWELSEDGSVLILDGTGDITVEKVDEWVNYNIKSISFSESVHYINNEVFAGLTHLETVSIGKNVERIGNGVFSGCTSLTSVTFPLLEYPSAINIGNGVFAGCTSLTSVTFQDTKVPTIGTDVFPENLTTIIVPAAALQSYYNATSWASYNTKLVASGSCGDHVTWTLTRLTTGFKVATAWEDVEPYNPTATTTVPAYKLTISGTDAMADYDGEGVTTPWAAADFNFPAGEWKDSYSDKTVITELEIGAGITALGSEAFTGLSNLTSLTIATGSALTTIAPADFAGNHTTVTLPTTVTTIDLKNNPATLQGHINNAAWRYYKSRFTPVGGYCGTTADDADGHNLSWTLEWKGEDADDNGNYPLTLTITGTGAMKDYGLNSDEAPWRGFFDILSPLPNELTTIGNFAFNYGAISGTLDIPTSVTRIGEWAFQNCSGLTAVSILGAKDAQGNALTTIDQAAFRDNSNLATVNLGDGVKDIGNNAFSSIGITEVTIPASVERIGFSAFAVCPSLKTVCINRGINGSITVFGHNQDGVYNQFGNCTSLETILVPAKALLSYLGADGWSSYADKVISTGYCGKKIYNSEPPYGLVADYTTNLIWTLSVITKTTDQGMTLETVTVDDKVLAALKLTVSANTANPVNPDAEEAFDMDVRIPGDNGKPAIYPFGTSDDEYISAIRDIVIEDGVTGIGNSVFRFPDAMKNINATIGKDVKTIDSEAFRGTNLANVTFAANSTLETIGYKAFQLTDLTDITIPASVKIIGVNAFQDCKQLATVTFEDSSTKPSQLTTIDGNAFENTKITTITLPKSVKNIDNAFRDCTTLQTVNFAADATIETIGYDAFLGCTSLTSITIPASVTMIENDVFLNCTSLSAVNFAEGSALKTVSASAFDGCTTLTQNDYVLNLPTTVTDVFSPRPSHLITSLAAKLWSNVTEKLSCSGKCGVEGEWVEELLDYTNSTNNVQFTMRSNGTLSDGSPALRMNIYKNTKNPTGSDFSIAGNDDADYMPWADARTNLTAVVIEDGVEGIGDNAFGGCLALKTFRVMPTTAPVLGTNVFDGCTALTDIIAPANYKTADGWQSEGIVEKLRADREDLFTGGTEWMTWCNDLDWSAPAGCNVYVVSGVGENTVTLTALTETANADRTEGEENAEGIRIPAYTPVILQKTVANATGLQARFAKVGTVPASGYNATTGLVTQSESNFNMLGNATDAAITEGGFTEQPFYSLYNGKFYRYEGTQAIAAHRCILTVSPVYTAPVLTIGTETTSVVSIDNGQLTIDNDVWYTLDGRKLDKQPTKKGIYVNGGRKVVIK